MPCGSEAKTVKEEIYKKRRDYANFEDIFF